MVVGSSRTGYRPPAAKIGPGWSVQVEISVRVLAQTVFPSLARISIWPTNLPITAQCRGSAKRWTGTGPSHCPVPDIHSAVGISRKCGANNHLAAAVVKVVSSLAHA